MSTSSSTVEPKQTTYTTVGGGGGHCADQDVSCSGWAKANYCEQSLYYEYLKATCPRSCNHCIASTMSSSISTSSSSTSSSSTVSSYSSTAAPTSSTWAPSTSTNAPNAVDTFEKCNNQHVSCVPWANAGYCTNKMYQAYLSSVCPLACGICGQA
eukprot:gene4201-8286_t